MAMAMVVVVGEEVAGEVAAAEEVANPEYPY